MTATPAAPPFSTAAQQLNQSIPNPVVVEFSGECSRSNLERLLIDLSGQGVDYIIAFGGGKLLDMGKLVADKLGLPQVMVPSLASTDAPCIAMGVVYTDSGEFEEYKFISRWALSACVVSVEGPHPVQTICLLEAQTMRYALCNLAGKILRNPYWCTV